MKIGIAADHGGFKIKAQIQSELEKQGFQVVDFGPHQLDPADDYPDYGIPAAEAVARHEVDRSILICNNGIGMCMLANKIPGIRAALVYNEHCALNTREHHDSNVLCLGGQEFCPEQLLKFTNIWLHTDFAGGRHERRMNKIAVLDKQLPGV
ncbi:MAG: RpiB/LacA/LacB family sugar-phosphate isomerase [Methylacidiphilales bacterium]|nr:RpiB/LacA/LacB family sugar-phosphate isomerase [Candidatus Methylacidiphilales bacterium]